MMFAIRRLITTRLALMLLLRLLLRWSMLGRIVVRITGIGVAVIATRAAGMPSAAVVACLRRVAASIAPPSVIAVIFARQVFIATIAVVPISSVAFGVSVMAIIAAISVYAIITLRSTIISVSIATTILVPTLFVAIFRATPPAGRCLIATVISIIARCRRTRTFFLAAVWAAATRRWLVRGFLLLNRLFLLLLEFVLFVFGRICKNVIVKCKLFAYIRVD